MCKYKAWIKALMLLLSCTTATALVRSINEKQWDLIESYKDPTANPCTDFYQYACGNWRTVHKNESYTNSVDVSYYRLQKDLEQLVKTRRQDLSRQPRFVRQMTYYKSCIEVSEYLPIEYISLVEKNEALIWPILDIPAGRQAQFWARLRKERNSSDAEYIEYWLKTLGTLRNYGMNGIFLQENVVESLNDSSKYLIHINRPNLGLEFKVMERTDFDWLTKAMSLSEAKADHWWLILSEFESKLVKLYEIEQAKADYQVYNFNDLPLPELKKYVKLVLNGTTEAERMQVSISNLPYMKALFYLLANYDDEFICCYLKLRFSWHLYIDGPYSFASKDCIDNLDKELPLVRTWLHEQQHPELRNETKNIELIFEKLKAHFLELIKKNKNNFTDEIVQTLSEKIENLQLKVGNLPRNATVAQLNAIHRQLALDESDFYGNHLKILRFRSKIEHDLLKHTKPQDVRNFYYISNENMILTLTLFYLQRQNIVFVPLSALHWPFYHAEFHDLLKYSQLGFGLAHEVSHSLDYNCLDYDSKGNVHSKDFIDLLKGNKILVEMTDCLRAKNPGGIGEKIADVSGLRLAYEAYFDVVNKNATVQQLPWAKVSQQQLFFRNFALHFCGDLEHDVEIEHDNHGTLHARVNDAISQFDEFGRAFNCQTGANLNPTRKCQAW